MLPADAPPRGARELAQDYVVRLAMAGHRPALIATWIGWRPPSVHQRLSRARAAGVVLPRFRTGPETARISRRATT